MKRIIFSGTSHTLGLGLELELHPRFSDVKWLEKNGVFQTQLSDPIYWKEDYEICKTYRWTKLVSDELGYEEFNCHEHGPRDGGTWPPGPLQFLKHLDSKTEEDLNDVEHIVIQTNHLRYHPIDGVSMLDGIVFGITPTEMLQYISDENNSEEVKQKIYEWIENYDEIEELKKFSKKITELKNKFSKIKFHILVWDQITNDFYLEQLSEIKDDLISITYNGFKSYSMQRIKDQFGLSIRDVAFCYTENKNAFGVKRWKESDFRDEHLSKFGHKVLADNVIKKIKGEDSLITNHYKSLI